jgi:riboflavin synthase
MFTGIIEEVGNIRSVVDKVDIHQYQVSASSDFISGVKQGDSIAVNGVCLTAYDIHQDTFQVDVSKETQLCTSFGLAKKSDQVNLERAVTPTTRLGGHFVSGHVDGIGKLVKREDNANETILWLSSPIELVKYIAVKGSICINGVSLTVNAVKENQFCVTIIPHTLQNTTLSSIQEQTALNIEVDLIARYLENIIQSRS